MAEHISHHRRTSGTQSELVEEISQYEKALRAADVVDLDDLITLPVRLLTENADLTAGYQRRFPWISVDEYQDVDDAQYRLLRLLSPSQGNICAIGDPDQSIYSFRGADVGFFLRFTEDYPQAKVIELNRNYRSTATIVSGAAQIISSGTLMPGRIFTPARVDENPAPIFLHRASTEQAEAEFITRTVDELLGGSSFHSRDSGRVSGEGLDSLSFSDIAVLYRTTAQATPIMQALSRAGMPCQKRSHDRLIDRPAVELLARELRFADIPGITVADRLRRATAALVDRPSTSERDEAVLTSADLHFAQELLMPLATRCGSNVTSFLTELSLGAEVDTWDPRADRISLLTLHAAKGLEFEVVFVAGCGDGLLPLRWSGKRMRSEGASELGEESAVRDKDNRAAEDDIAEERRLFFVGMTRARSRLYLSHAGRRNRHGKSMDVKPSEFLDALDEGLLERITAPRVKRPQDFQLRLL